MNENERKYLIVQIKSSKPTFVAMEAVIKVIEKESEKQKRRTVFLIPCSLPFFIGILSAIGVVRKVITGMLLKDFGIMFIVVIALLFPFSFCLFAHIRRNHIIRSAIEGIHKMKDDPILSWLPYEHRNPVDYEFISNCILNNKTSSVSEAIELLKNDEVIPFIEKITGNISRKI
ncbi:MAG: hypothetical protein MJ071_02845 [Oscillospiraceae bacterium]|nr:hypothetical protein [Oscillospiraceae bacterium]